MKSLSEIYQRAVVRARFVRGEIESLRGVIADRHTLDTDQACALLASYDRELDRLCAVDGVMIALLEDLKAP